MVNRLMEAPVLWGIEATTIHAGKGSEKKRYDQTFLKHSFFLSDFMRIFVDNSMEDHAKHLFTDQIK